QPAAVAARRSCLRFPSRQAQPEFPDAGLPCAIGFPRPTQAPPPGPGPRTGHPSPTSSWLASSRGTGAAGSTGSKSRKDAPAGLPLTSAYPAWRAQSFVLNRLKDAGRRQADWEQSPQPACQASWAQATRKAGPANAPGFSSGALKGEGRGEETYTASGQE